jgi:hypothetical protein
MAAARAASRRSASIVSAHTSDILRAYLRIGSCVGDVMPLLGYEQAAPWQSISTCRANA